MNVFFESAALIEYREAALYSQQRFRLGEEFVQAVEAAIVVISSDPGRFQALEAGIRIFRLRRFPYHIFFLHSAGEESITVYAVAHHGRQPGYWRGRLRQTGQPE